MNRIKEILVRIAFLGEIYAVGGCVRDILLGLEPKDIDVAAKATPQEVTAMAEARGYLQVISCTKVNTWDGLHATV